MYAGKEFNISFRLSLITYSNLKHNTIFMISNSKTHNGIFTSSYVSVLNINSTHYAIIFKRRLMRECWKVLSPTRKVKSYSDQTGDSFSIHPTKLNTLLSPLL